MAYRILILGASYGSLLGTKLAMAGHDVSLVCRPATAQLINEEGTDVGIRLRDEGTHRTMRSVDLPGHVDALTPEQADPAAYDLVGLAMQETQYGAPAVRGLMRRIADTQVPCLSIMNMPPLPFLRRIPGLDTRALEACFTDARVWDGFDPGLVSLCSPDPQAFRPPNGRANILHVGLATNFKAAPFADASHNEMLADLEADIAAVRLDGKEVPVKLRLYQSLFVPFAKWGMLMTGNYRCIGSDGIRPIRDAVHDDLSVSRQVFDHVDALVRSLGADARDQVPFEKYADAAQKLLKPSSAARAVAGGATQIERVDRLVQEIGNQLGVANAVIDETVDTVDTLLARNSSEARVA